MRALNPGNGSKLEANSSKLVIQFRVFLTIKTVAMKKTCLLIYFLSFTILHAQTIIQKDPEIEKMLKEVSADSLQSYIKTLVAFGTRNTLSTQTNSQRGIGAARNWVLSKFNQFANSSSGRLTAFIDTVTLSLSRRVDTPALLGNVVATLKGTDAKDNRIFIVSAHLDNMRTNVMDRIGNAPGANDDGSGSAAVIECARIMSKHSFSATVICNSKRRRARFAWLNIHGKQSKATRLEYRSCVE